MLQLSPQQPKDAELQQLAVTCKGPLHKPHPPGFSALLLLLLLLLLVLVACKFCLQLSLQLPLLPHHN